MYFSGGVVYFNKRISNKDLWTIKKKPYIKLINRLMKDFSNPTSVCTYFEKQLYWHVARHLLVGY